MSIEIRCPIYGFIPLSDWEREIIEQPAFQRLRRIRQLGWTDYVYPGAMHTRFEHSLGVMHMATMLFDSIVEHSREILTTELGYNETGLERHRALVRLAALLHDVGHSPFSHAGEELFPRDPSEPTDRRYRHEAYSAAIIREFFADVIKNHQENRNYGFTADDVANLLANEPEAENALFWRDLIDGQMDADRMDYLLRDSHHAGVDYGRYDWRRVVNSVVALPGNEQGGPRLGIAEGGWHAAEGLIIARYMMFTQVYFHKTRVILDWHIQKAMATMLAGGTFQEPSGRRKLNQYLKWDDWRVLGLLAKRRGGEEGERLCARRFHREVAHTTESPDGNELQRIESMYKALDDLSPVMISAERSWYKRGSEDIQVTTEGASRNIRPLSSYSSIVKNMGSVRQVRLYVPIQHQQQAEERLAELGAR